MSPKGPENSSHGDEWKGYVAKGYPHKEGEDDVRLSNIPDNPELDIRNLLRAAEMIFHGTKKNFAKSYRELTELLYRRINLEERGAPFVVSDIDILAKLLLDGFKYVLEHTTKNNRTNRLTVIGCGPGRLAVAYVELAKLIGVTRIIFNDLIDEHINSTRDKIDKTYGSDKKVDNIKIAYVAGDFCDDTQVPIGPYGKLRPSDYVVAMWYVTSEMLKLISPKSLRTNRLVAYSRFGSIIDHGGVFIEDIPDSRQGFFYDQRRVTIAALKKAGVDLGAENSNLGITHLVNASDEGDAATPHIRYIPPNGIHDNEVRVGGGLFELSSILTQQPNPGSFVQGSDIQIIRLFDQMRNGSSAEVIHEKLKTREGFAEVRNQFKEVLLRVVRGVVNGPSLRDERKKTILWKNRGP
jgi:hypothetical protein